MTTIIQEEFAALLDPGCVANSCHDNSTLTRQGGLVSKRCTKCGSEKALSEFAKNTASKDGLRTDCRACKAERMRRWYANPENRAKIAEAQRRWRQSPENRAKEAEGVRRYRQTPEGRAKVAEARRHWRRTPEGRAKQAEAHRRWRQTPEGRAKATEVARRYRQTLEGKTKKAEYMRRRHRTDPQFRLANLLRGRLRHALKGISKSSRTLDLLGCTLEHFTHHLESRFQPGMSWLNQGEWHIDHIKPLKAFDLSDPEQQRQACHWSNLQPLWAADNIRKGAKYH